jgi:5-methylcytosine-specific restriction endonuclease McrA
MPKKPKRQSVSRTVERVIYEKYKGRCAICKEKTPFDEGVIDHIKPVSKGGTSGPSNLQWLCHRCNGLKGNTRTNKQVKELLKGKK